MTTVAYIITLLLVFLTITTLFQSLIAGFFSRIFGLPINLGAFLGAVITWLLLNFLWTITEGGSIPLIILIISLIYIVTHYMISKDELTSISKANMIAEFWAILLLAIFLMISNTTIRWV